MTSIGLDKHRSIDPFGDRSKRDQTRPVTLCDLRSTPDAHRAADPGGNLDRQSDCRYRARTAVRLAAGRKQALASLTSLPLAGHASIAAACAFTPPPRSPTANDHEVLNGFGRRPASCPAMLPAVTVG